MLILYILLLFGCFTIVESALPCATITIGGDAYDCSHNFVVCDLGCITIL